MERFKAHPVGAPGSSKALNSNKDLGNWAFKENPDNKQHLKDA